MIKTYVPKERKVNAIQWDGKNLTDLINFVGNQLSVVQEKCIGGSTWVGLKGKFGACTEINLKDFIVKEIDDTFAVYNPSTFKKRYKEYKDK